MSTKTSRVVAGAAIALALGSGSSAAQWPRTVDAGDGLYLRQEGRRALLREPGGGVSELQLPPGLLLQRLEPLADGWIAAGEVYGEGITDLLLLRGDAAGYRPLEAPLNRHRAALRGGPLPLVERGRLVGLAWLEGDGVRSTAVWAARWSGLDWSDPELVSPPGPGTQIAIDGAVLADGSWLLLWAAYDGDDDEILWSRRDGEAWSAPQRLHPDNPWPDVTPAVVASGRGALAAWNGYDGWRYRVRLAAFEDGAWSELGPADAAGAVSPDLLPRGGGALLVYRTVVPPSWALRELAADGRVVRAAAVEIETTSRPGFVPQPDGGAALEWPGERPGSPVAFAVEWRTEP